MSFDTGLISVSRAGLSTGLPASVLDDDCMVIAVSDASNSAGLPISAVDWLKIAVGEASSSTGWMIPAVGETGLVAEASDNSSDLTVFTAADSG